ncbi:Interleukin-17 receptor D [Takifugu flavidus]|uniref:Interleukin-17 receptor D n=1 Tax=Takifugu flavidus TaxID=433684 RepID=A0A5C6NA65_9TELE|nr:Interleukin-17 receptor D [Takifugu flavidus]
MAHTEESTRSFWANLEEGNLARASALGCCPALATPWQRLLPELPGSARLATRPEGLRSVLLALTRTASAERKCFKARTYRLAQQERRKAGGGGGGMEERVGHEKQHTSSVFPGVSGCTFVHHQSDIPDKGSRNGFRCFPSLKSRSSTEVSQVPSGPEGSRRLSITFRTENCSLNYPLGKHVIHEVTNVSFSHLACEEQAAVVVRWSPSPLELCCSVKRNQDVLASYDPSRILALRSLQS